MTAPQLAANRANAQLSTGPRTDTGKARASQNSFKHGLCGKIHIVAPEDAEAFNHHCRLMCEALAPVGVLEEEFAQDIAADHWRLKRARSLESAIFAQGPQNQSPESQTGDPEIDAALADGQTWIEQARNLQLLTLYEQRINRTLNKNTAKLEAMQAERKAAYAQAVQEAIVLTELAQSKGEIYHPLPDFPNPENPAGFIYSSSEIARLIDRADRLRKAAALFAHAPAARKSRHSAAK
jgi:hypothetical protein